MNCKNFLRIVLFAVLSACVIAAPAWAVQSADTKKEDKISAGAPMAETKAAVETKDKASATGIHAAGDKAVDAKVSADGKGSYKAAPVVDPDYVIGVEDVLAVNVWREPELSRTVSVRPDGKISLPLVGEFEADGQTPKKLEENLTVALQKLVTSPEVTVMVQEIHSQKFNIVGEVNQPGTFPLTGHMSVLDAIALAGGFKDFAKPKKMYILRRNRNGPPVRISVDYKKLIQGAAPAPNMELQTRDILVVP